MNVAAVAARPLVRPRARTTRWVIARHTARSAWLWAVVCGAVFGLFVISTEQAFLKGYPTLAERTQLAHSMQAFEILIGRGHHLETVAGFTSWRLMTTTAVIGAIWALRTSTGLLRGEENAGRWEVLLASPTTPRRATLEALFGLGAALLAMFMVTALFTVLAGRLPGARFALDVSLLHALSLVSGAAMFLAIGALTSQVSATSDQAAMLGSAVLGLSYVVRLVADANKSLGWLHWASPLGWLEELRPLRDPQPIAPLPMVVLILVCGVLTVVLAGRRDLNAGVLREREGGTECHATGDICARRWHVLGAGTLVFGVWPQLTAAAGYGIVAWSFLLDLLAALDKNADWLKDSSLFTHIALAPAVKPDWGADAIMALLGIGCAVIGALAFQRRDIEYA